MFKFGNHAKMVTKDPVLKYKDVTVMNKGSVVTGATQSSSATRTEKLLANTDAFGAGGGSNPNTSQGGGSYNNSGTQGYNHDIYNNVWDRLDEGTVIEGWIPRDASGLDALYRRIALRDPTLGPGIDILKNLPWSDFNLTGIEDKAILRIYQDCMDSLQVPLLMPEVLGDYLTIGRNIITLAFDERRGIFTGVMPHDPDFIKITPIPIFGYDPICDFKLTPGFKAFLNSTDPRAMDARRSLPQSFIQAAMSTDGFLPLDPVSTIYLGRKASQSDYVGTSILTRALYFWGIEKALLNAQVTSVRRRARSFIHATVGIDEKWEPTSEEMDAIVAMAIQTNEDPTGGIVATRTGVSFTEPLSSGQDMYKWSDELELFSKYKMQVLGISDALLNGDATYSNSEQARSVFVEMLANLRFRICQVFFYNKLFPTLARLHGFVKRTKAEIDHNIRTSTPETASLPVWAKASPVLARQLSQRERMNIPHNELIMPTIDWLKQLRPNQDIEALNLLDTLKNNGYPVTVSQWASAAGFTVENLDTELKQDLKIRKIITDYDSKVQNMSSDTSAEGGDGFGFDIPEGDAEAQPEEDGTEVEQSLQAKLTEIKSGVVGKTKDIGIWKHNRIEGLNVTKRQVDMVIGAITKEYKPELLKDRESLIAAISTKFAGNQDKVFATVYVLNRLGLTNIKIPKKVANKIAESAHKALQGNKDFNSNKFLISLAKFEKEMKALHFYSGGEFDLKELPKVLKSANSLGSKQLSGLY